MIKVSDATANFLINNQCYCPELILIHIENVWMVVSKEAFDKIRGEKS